MCVIACLTFVLKGSRILKGFRNDVSRMDPFCFILQYLTITKRKARCKRTRQLPILFPNNVGSCGVRLHVAKGLTGLCATKLQQSVETDATHSNIQQCWELLANNVASVCTGL